MVVLLVILGGLSLFVLTTAGLALLNGWVLSVLWGWFVVPTFGLPSLSVVEAIGIALIAAFLTHQYHSVPKEKTREYYLILFFSPLIALFIGWLVHLFM